MNRIPCPPYRHAVLHNQELRRARQIICNRLHHSAGAIDMAMKTIAALSPHIDAVMAKAALASRRVAA